MLPLSEDGRLKNTLVVLTFGLAVAPASARGQAPALTLDDCIRLASSSASALNAARHQSEIASLGLAQARSALLPQARANAAFAYNSATAAGGDAPAYVALNGAREWSALVSVFQEVDTTGRLRATQAPVREGRGGARGRGEGRGGDGPARAVDERRGPRDRGGEPRPGLLLDH